MEDIGRATTEENFIEQTRCESVCVSGWEGNDKDSLGKTVNYGKGFGFAGRGGALALKVHSVTGSGFVGVVSGEHAVS
jgi:hypothetical protein